MAADAIGGLAVVEVLYRFVARVGLEILRVQVVDIAVTTDDDLFHRFHYRFTHR